MNKKDLKFLSGMIVLALLLVYGPYIKDVVIYGKGKADVIQYYKNIERQYMTDNYGGDTPEETLRLFVEALKKGDTNLAAKYFLPEDQDQWRKYFLDRQGDGKLRDIEKDAQNLKLEGMTETNAFYVITDDQNVANVTVVLVKNSNNKWKLSEL